MNSIETSILRLIGENVSSPDVFTDDATGMAQIRASVNDAIQEICMTTGSYTRTYHLQLLEKRSFYRLAPVADHVAYVIGAWDREDKRKLVQTDLSTLSRDDYRWMDSDGPPTHYIQLGFEHIAIYRRPSAEGHVIELTCVCIPKAYTRDTEWLKLKEQYQRAATHFGASEYFASRGDAGRATEHYTKYIETAGLMALHAPNYERLYEMGQRQGNWRLGR